MRRYALLGLAVCTVFVLGGCGQAQRPVTAAPILESFVFTTEDGATTRIWLADPAKPSVRRLLQAVDHQSGWAGVAKVSPNGQLLAFTLLRSGERDPDHGASLRILDIRTRQSHALAEGVDLRSALVWAPDGGALIYERFEGTQQQLWLQPASGDPGTRVATAATGERLIPLGLSGVRGQLLDVRFGPRGVDLRRDSEGSTSEPLLHLSDGTARDLKLSPGGQRLAYLAVDRSSPSPTSRAYVMDLVVSSIRELPSDWGEAVGVAWEPNDVLVVGTAGDRAGLRTEAGDKLAAPAGRGFLQPLSWAPSGRYLAVRSFTGTSSTEPGSARDAILTQRGNPVSITETLPVRFVGWVKGGNQSAPR